MIIDNGMTQRRVESTAAFIKGLSTVLDGGISYPVEQLALRYLIDTRDCPLCGACAGFMCKTFGAQNLRRTHMERLVEVTPLERRLAVEWALLEYQRQCLEDES
jgi:hypothetical protein